MRQVGQFQMTSPRHARVQKRPSAHAGAAQALELRGLPDIADAGPGVAFAAAPMPLAGLGLPGSLLVAGMKSPLSSPSGPRRSNAASILQQRHANFVRPSAPTVFVPQAGAAGSEARSMRDMLDSIDDDGEAPAEEPKPKHLGPLVAVPARLDKRTPKRRSPASAMRASIQEANNDQILLPSGFTIQAQPVSKAHERRASQAREAVKQQAHYEEHLRTLLGELEPEQIERVHEVREQVNKLFEIMDYDMDGQVTRDDYKSVFGKGWAELSKQVDTMFDALREPQAEEGHMHHIDNQRFADIFAQTSSKVHSDQYAVSRLNTFERESWARERYKRSANRPVNSRPGNDHSQLPLDLDWSMPEGSRRLSVKPGWVARQ